MYPAVEEQGLIGTFSAALVADDGTIDWFCAPRSARSASSRLLFDEEEGRTE
jgi:hypothetical protein